MESTRTPAVVLKRVPYGEADLVVTLYTRDLGKLSALARSARRSQRRFGGVLDLFTVSEAELKPHRGGDLWTLGTAALRASYTDLARKVHGASLGLAAGENPGSIASRLRLWGASKELILKAARRVTPERAAALLRAAVENDVRLKTSQGDPVVNLEALTIRFTRTLA